MPIEFVSQPMTLGEHVLLYRVKRGDIEALAELLTARAVAGTMEEEILALTDAELGPAIERMVQGVQTATVLATLDRSWGTEGQEKR